MTARQKHIALTAGAIVLGGVLVARYVFSFGSVMYFLGLGFNPLNILSYLLDPLSIGIILAIFGLLTWRNIVNSEQSQKWRSAHDGNIGVAPEPVVLPRKAKPLEVELTNEQYIAFMSNGSIGVTQASLGGKALTPGGAVMLRHEDDYGQVSEAVARELSPSGVWLIVKPETQILDS